MPKKTADRFKLEIEMGNDAMLTRRDVAAAITQVATAIRYKDVQEGAIFDQNGNKVGGWALVNEKDVDVSSR